MYYNLFDDLQTRLEAATGLPVQWFNVQYEGSIINEKVLFVEFVKSEDNEQLTKQERKEALRIRVHVVTKLLSKTDGSIVEASIQANDLIASTVKASLTRYVVKNGESILTKPLYHANTEPWQRHKGWFIQFIDFTSRLVYT